MSLKSKLRSLGRKERCEKDMKHKAALREQAILDTTPVVQCVDIRKTTLERVALEATVMNSIGVSREVTQENVGKACKVMCQLVHQQGNGKLRTSVLYNLPGEIRTVLQGRTAREVYDFYWSLDIFRAAWSALQFEPARLRFMINVEAVRLGKEPYEENTFGPIN
jgi:hypothetical protein